MGADKEGLKQELEINFSENAIICIDEIDVIPSVDQNTKKYSILIIWCFQYKKMINYYEYGHIDDNNIKAINM